MPTQNSQDAELAKFFTDVEPLRDWFDKAIARGEGGITPPLPKRLLVIHGVGGIGKSSLLRMFRLNCKTARVAVALASGDEAKSAVDVLTRWAEDLKSDGVNLPTFSKTLEHYRAIQAKVESKTDEARKKLGDVAGKAASKTAEAAGGAALGAALGSVIPGIGTAAGAALGGVIGGMGAEALVDYLRGFLTKPDIDLLLDPSKKLTEDFLADVNQGASSRRVVLMLDTYEQMTALDDWTREVAQRLNENILLVIAGRAMVNWGRQWSSWLMHAEVQELKPMTKRVMHELIRKYYATMRGGEPNPKQVNAIIEFSDGLPMVVNTAVQLWVKYGVEDFDAVKGEAVREVVERLREGVPTELYPLLETAAALRYFNKEILRVVSGMGDISAGYEELRRFPFVRSRVEGYALHDRVREMIEENVRTDDPTKYRMVHERAAAYFEARLANATGEEVERLGLERLYHRVCADEDSGIKLFQEVGQGLVRYRLANQLRELLNDVNTYSLQHDNSRLWREYYNARLVHLEGHWREVEKIYAAISEEEHAESKLRAYALCDLGQMLVRNVRLSEPGGIQRAIKVLERSQEFSPEMDSKLVFRYSHFQYIYTFQCNWNQDIVFAQKQYDYFLAIGDQYGVIYAVSLLKDIYALIGNWKRARESMEEGLDLLETTPDSPFLKLRLTGDRPWDLIGAGNFAEAELHIKEGLDFVSRVGDENSLPPLFRNLGLVLGYQGKHSAAAEYFEQAIEKYEQRGEYGDIGIGIVLGFRGENLVWQGKFEEGQDDLKRSLVQKQKSNDNIGIPQILNWLGELHEIRASKRSDNANATALADAESYFRQSLEYRWIGRRHYECSAIMGLVRVKYAQGEFTAIPPLLAEAEQLAQQYEYNDHLASLRLTQGHIAWEGRGDVVSPEQGEMTSPLHYYQHALIYALRFNRFLLDEVLSGRPQSTPLRPIISECLKRGDEGRKMLLALREWWQTGKNDIGAPRPDTISPIPENIALVEAEKIAREREPGDGTKQRWVVEQIDSALAK